MEKNTTSRRSALIVAAASSFVTPFMGSSINVALPSIEKAFQIDAVLLSWVATAYLLAIGVSLVPMGRLADIYGRKKILAIGFACFTTASLLSALAWSAYSLIAFRIIQGFGSGMIFGTSMAILTSVFPPNERGRVLGISVASVYVGLSSGPFVGGILTQHLSWRSLFVVTFLLCLIVLRLILFKLEGEWADAGGEPFDIPGSLIYGLTLVFLITGFSLLPDMKSIVLLALAGVGMVLFVVQENRTRFPVFKIELLSKNRTFALSNAAALIHYSATFAVTFLISLYLQYLKGLNAQSAGFILISQPVMMALFSPLAGRISDYMEPRFIASFGMGTTSIGLILLTFLTQHSPIVFVVGVLLLMGFGFAMFSSPNMNAIMSSVDRRFLGIASGSAGTMRVLGQLFSMGMATLVLALFMGRVPITEDVYPLLMKSIRTVLILFSGLTFFGIFASLARGSIR
ncbi:MAG: MFS transporter [Desulfobacterales bacterium]